jgi:hypothetical protein
VGNLHSNTPLGLVIDEMGFAKRSKIFEGNVSEGKTLLFCNRFKMKK